MANETWTPSVKQTDIFAWFAAITKAITEHLVVRARAGTGKTSTIIRALSFMPKGLNVLVCAFGKDIQLELAARINGTPGVEARTNHSIGLQAVKRFWPDVKVGYGSDREEDLAQRVCGMRAPDAIKKLVAKLCTKGRLVAPHAKVMGDLTTVAIEFECNPDEQWEADGFGLDYVEARALEAMELAASEKPLKTGIDGADMLFLPVRNQWLRKTYDVVIVDEGQDMNACQLEIAQGVCKGRLIVVGDDCQAIYAFAGADSGSLDRLKRELNATELPLNVTYRCGKAIVAVAQQYVPDFEAGPDNADGLVRSCSELELPAQAGPGDFILSRVNAPLVSIAMKLLRSGKRTRVAGQDIGNGLISLIRKLKGKTVPELLGRIEGWARRENVRLEAQLAKATNGRKKTIQAKIDAVLDKADMLTSLADGARNVDEIVDRITGLFTDDGLGDKGLIVCSSVHKAKGKEADRVFVLQSTLRDYNQEEKNIAYVAITRAKHELVWVA